jgi:hypothetical protein
MHAYPDMHCAVRVGKLVGRLASLCEWTVVSPDNCSGVGQQAIVFATENIVKLLANLSDTLRE